MVFIKVIKHSESGRSAFCKCTRKLAGFSSEIGVGYLYRDEEDEEAELAAIGTTLKWPGDVAFEDMVDHETGELRTTKDGESVLQRIVLK